MPDVAEVAGVIGRVGIARPVDEVRVPPPLGLDGLPSMRAGPQRRAAVHAAVRVHGPCRDLDVQVRLGSLLAVHVHDRDGLVAARLPVGDERLGARLALLRRALGGQLDDLRRQDALGGRAPAHAGAGLDPVGVAEQRLLVPGAALYIGRVALVLALAEDVGEPVAGGHRSAHFHAAESRMERADDALQTAVSGDPPDAVIHDSGDQCRRRLHRHDWVLFRLICICGGPNK